MKRFVLRRTGDPKYPVGVWDKLREEWRGWYYTGSMASARCKCAALNFDHDEKEKERLAISEKGH